MAAQLTDLLMLYRPGDTEHYRETMAALQTLVLASKLPVGDA